MKKSKDSKKVLILHNTLWSHYKGAVFSELYKFLMNEGFIPLFIHMFVSEKGRETLGKADRLIHQYPYKVLFEKNLEETVKLERIIAVIKELFNFKPDIVILPGYAEISYWAGFITAKIMRCKVIIGMDSTEYDKPRLWYKESIKKLFVKNCDGAFCYGLAASSYVQKLGGKNGPIIVQRCQATANDEIARMWQEAYKTRDRLQKEYGVKEKNFIYVGRLSEEKNIKILIKAFYNIRDEAKGWGLIIVGNGPDREKLEVMTKELGLEDIFFMGGKSWREVPMFYALADVLVLPSISEPWGLVVNEAMLCGLPVIVSNRAGASFDLINWGENGFTFDPYNVKELEDLMLKFTRVEINIKKMGKNSKNIISKFTPKHAANQMINGIKNVLGEK
jgi:glycosyltransferase involved in cell wall biosynthesis